MRYLIDPGPMCDVVVFEPNQLMYAFEVMSHLRGAALYRDWDGALERYSNGLWGACYREAPIKVLEMLTK